MSEAKEEVLDLFGLDDIIDANVINYDTVKAYGGKVRIGSLNSDDMLEWIEQNEDKDKRKRAGLRLLVRSLVDKDGNRVPENRIEEAVNKFGKKDAKENGKVIEAALRLNGLDRAARLLAALKND